MLKQCRLILSLYLLISQSLLVVPQVQAQEASDADFLPMALQGIVSQAYAKQTTNASASRTAGIGEQARSTGISAVGDNPSSSAHFLHGGVEQKVKLPAQQQEAKVEEIQLMKETAQSAPSPSANQVRHLSAQESVLAGNQVWFRIPGWLAGKWKTQDKQLVGEINYRTGKQTAPQALSFGYCGEQYGLQQDKNGMCWQFEKVGKQPTNYRLDKNGIAHFDIVESNHPLSSSNRQLVLQKTWRNVTMDPQTAEIISERRLQSVLTFKRLDEDGMSINDATETYDRDGTPISMRVTQTERVKVAPFQPVDNLHGDDVHALFGIYMSRHGLANLLSQGDSM